MFSKKPALIIGSIALSLLCIAAAPADKQYFYMRIDQAFTFNAINIKPDDLNNGFRREMSASPLLVSSRRPWKIQAKLAETTCSHACRVSLRHGNNEWSSLTGTAFIDINGLRGVAVNSEKYNLEVKIDVDWLSPPFTDGRGKIAIKILEDI